MMNFMYNDRLFVAKAIIFVSLVCLAFLFISVDTVAGLTSKSYGKTVYEGEGGNPQQGDKWVNSANTQPTWTVVGKSTRPYSEKYTYDGLPMSSSSGGHCIGGPARPPKITTSVQDITSTMSQQYRVGWDLQMGSYPFPGYPSASKIKQDANSFQNCRYSIAKKFTATRQGEDVQYLIRAVPFSYTPRTSVDKKVSYVGDNVTFSHTITRSGTPPSTASASMSTVSKRTGAEFEYNYGIVKRLSCNLNPSDCYFDNRILPTISNRKTMSYKTQITIEKDTPEGVVICYETRVTPASQSGGTRTSEDNACTTVKKAESLSFNLEPSVDAVVKGPAEPGSRLELKYDVSNKSSTTESSDVRWSTYGIEVNPGVDVRPITDGARRESATPQSLVAALGGASKARIFEENKYNGQTRFLASKTTQVAREAFQIPTNAAIGSRFCFLLMVTPPTQEASPTNRHSLAKCIIVGKKPKVNIWGGDLYVGRRFSGDTVSPTSLESSIHTSISAFSGATNRAYGSWAEYDAHAPGEITGFATASGLQGGRETSAPEDQSQWSKLTFANTPDYYGGFGATSARGTIPDVMTAAMRDAQIARTLADTETTLSLNDTNAATQKIARYDKPNGNLTLSGGTLNKGDGATPGKSIIITVPKGTVTITGDLRYAAGPYLSATEIPQLVIVAKNIIVKDTVTHIDSWLVAKAPADTPIGTSGSDPTNPIGVIKTCDIETNLTIHVCNQRLTVNGPVMANQILLRRTAGLAGPPEGGAAPSDDTPAEVFNLRADTYLWIYSQGKNNTRAITTYTRELGPRF